MPRSSPSSSTPVPAPRNAPASTSTTSRSPPARARSASTARATKSARCRCRRPRGSVCPRCCCSEATSRVAVARPTRPTVRLRDHPGRPGCRRRGRNRRPTPAQAASHSFCLVAVLRFPARADIQAATAQPASSSLLLSNCSRALAFAPGLDPDETQHEPHRTRPVRTEGTPTPLASAKVAPTPPRFNPSWATPHWRPPPVLPRRRRREGRRRRRTRLRVAPTRDVLVLRHGLHPMSRVPRRWTRRVYRWR